MLPIAPHNHTSPTLRDTPTVGAVTYDSDRRRIEKAVPALMLQRILRRAVEPDTAANRDMLLNADIACKAPFYGLDDARRAKLQRRAWVLQNRALSGFIDRSCVLTTGAVGFWIIDLIDAGYLELSADAPIAAIAETLFTAARTDPAWPGMERSARKSAKRLQRDFEAAGYFNHATGIRWTTQY